MIELRWKVFKIECSFPGSLRTDNIVDKVLQYRTGRIIFSDQTDYGSSGIVEWSDWQDVPEVPNGQ